MTGGVATIAEAAVGWLGAVSLQVAVFALLVGIVDRLLGKRAAPEFRYGLWMLVAARLVLPPSLSAPWAAWKYLSPSLPLGGTLSSDTGAGGGPLTAATTSIALLAIWALGAAMFGATVFFRNRRLRRRLARGASSAPPRVLAAARRAADAVGLRETPPILLAEDAPGPLVTGCLRPIVVLPTHRSADWTDAELEHLLCHELAHVKRHDLWAELVFAVLNAAYWFHPLVWLARRCAARARELCCDATAARATGPGYRRTLTRIAADTLLHRASAGSMGIKGRRSAMLTRLRQLERHRPTTRTKRLARAFALFAFAALLLPMARAAQPATAPGVVGPAGSVADRLAAVATDDREAASAAALRAIEAAVDKTPGFGSLHARYGLMQWNAARAAGADIPEAQD